jgi:hypothetical protein
MQPPGAADAWQTASFSLDTASLNAYRGGSVGFKVRI